MKNEPVFSRPKTKRLLLQLLPADFDKNRLNGKHWDLELVDLSGKNLQNFDLRWANLKYAKLMCAQLSSADLSHANLFTSNLEGAQMWDANFTGANFEDACLAEIDCMLACFKHTIMVGIDIKGADIGDADFTDADLESADFTGAKVLSNNFANANIAYAIMLQMEDLLSWELRKAKNVHLAHLPPGMLADVVACGYKIPQDDEEE